MHFPDEGARHILKYYRKLSQRPGDVLRRQSFCDPFGEAGWRQDEFEAAMARAIERGWIELDGAWYALTNAGLRAYEMLPSGGSGWRPSGNRAG